MKVVKQCQICGADFEIYASYASRYVTCPEHRGKTKFGKLSHRWKGDRDHEITCLGCGIVLVTIPYWVGKKKFCSMACYDKNRGGVNHPNWRGGVSAERVRMAAECQRWRKAVLKRDDRTCVWCGSTENLEADHIKSWAEFPELRFDLSNGRTLCLPCHKKTPSYGNRKAA